MHIQNWLYTLQAFCSVFIFEARIGGLRKMEIIVVSVIVIGLILGSFVLVKITKVLLRRLEAQNPKQMMLIKSHVSPEREHEIRHRIETLRLCASLSNPQRALFDSVLVVVTSQESVDQLYAKFRDDREIVFCQIA